MVGVGGGGGGSEAGDGSRRRLPSWMVGVNVNKSDDEGLNCNSNSKEPPKPRRRKSTQQHREEEEEDDDDGEINITRTQKKRKVREPAPPKKSEKKLKEITQTSVDQIEDDKNTNGDEDDEEKEEEQLTLTVEDLLSIAKEYVQADRERGEVQSSSNRDLESEKKLLASTSLENGGDFLNQKLSTDSAVGSTGEQSLVSISGTGDPAQDMLDLFLGPLLKIPVEDQNRTKFTTNDIVDIEFRKLSQSQTNDAGQEHIVAAPVMKKKTSLKDKVAMLLD